MPVTFNHPLPVVSALSVLENPEFCDRHPDYRLRAWAVMKEHRGQTVDFDRLERMGQHAAIINSLAGASL